MSLPLKLSKIIFSIKITSALVSGVIEINNHVFQSENRKNFLELKIKNEPAPIPRKIKNIINEVMNEMKLNEEDRSLIKAFMTTNLQLKALGYSKIKPGAFLGIPESFYFENYPYIIPTNFTYMIEEIKFPPETVVSQALKQSCFLSEKAKKFGLARELYESGHAHIFFLAFGPAFLSALMLSILLLSQMCKKCLIKLYPIGYVILTVPSEIIILIFLRDKIRIHSEGKADFQAASLGLSYIEGGIEYYEKMMDRYKILKSVNKDFPFNNDGDINQTRYKPQHMPLNRRVTYLKDLMKAEQTSTKKPHVWNYMFS